MKIKKYLLLLIAAFSLIVSSCNNIASDDDDDDKKSSATITNEATGEETMTPVVTKKLDSEGALAYLSVSIDELTGSVQSARTVLPDYNTEGYRYQGFTSFVLTGSLSSAPGTVYDIAKWETTTETEGETETTTTAYSKLTRVDSYIPLRLFSNDKTTEAWTFTLTATHGTGDNTITYSGSVEKNIRANTTSDTDTEEAYKSINSLSFTLSRTSAYKFSSATTATGKLDLTLSYSTPAEADIKLYKCDSATGVADTSPEAEVTLTINDDKTSVTAGAIPEGFYELQIALSNHGISVGSLTEYVYILQGLTSKKTIDINVNGNYSITYFYKVLDIDELHEITYVSAADEYSVSDDPFFAGTDHKPYHDATQAMYYTRLEGVTLPQPTDFVTKFQANETNTGNEYSYIFCGWYEDEAFIKGPILDIKANSTIGDKTYYGKFIDKRELPRVTAVEITADSSVKVGHTLTATAKTGTEGSYSDFAGTILNWKWYYEPTDSERSVISDATVSEKTAGNLITTSSYTVRPKYAQKVIKAVAQQRYTVRNYESATNGDDKDETATYGTTNCVYNDSSQTNGKVRTYYTAEDYRNAGVYKVVENDYEYEGTTNTNEYPAVEKATSEINLGTLAVTDSAFKLYYTYTTDDDGSTETTLINTPLRDEGLATPFASILSTVHDANTASWALNDTTTFVDTNNDSSYYSIAFTSASKAPDASNYVPVTITVDGYEPLALTGNNGAFIKVRYDTPTNADIRSVLWDSGDTATIGENSYTDAAILEGFDKDTISFAKSSYPHTYAEGVEVTETPFKYQIGTSPEVTEIATRAASALGEANGSSEVSVTGGKTLVFTAVDKAGTNDTKGNLVGAVYGSLSGYSMTFTPTTEADSTENNAACIGSRISIQKLVLKEGDTVDSSFAVGHTISVTPIGPNDSAIGYSDIEWTIKRLTVPATSDSEAIYGTDLTSSLTGLTAGKANTTGYTIVQDDYISDASTVQLQVVAKRTYSFNKEVSVPATFTVAKGVMNLEGMIVTYNPTDANPTLEVGTKGVGANIKGSGENGAFTGAVDANTTTNAIVIDSVDFASTVTETGGTGDYVDKKVGTATLTVKALGYADKTTTLTNIPLRYTMTEAIALLTDKTKVSYGSIKFNSETFGTVITVGTDRTASSYEYKIFGSPDDIPETAGGWANDTTGWATLPDDEFDNPFTSDSGTIYVRVKSTAETDGYYASTPVAVTYSETTNAGSMGGTIEVSFENVDVALNTPNTSNAGTIVITPKTDFTVKFWKIDGDVIASGDTVLTVSNDKQSLTITTAELGSGDYNITAVGTKTGVTGTYSAGVTVHIGN